MTPQSTANSPRKGRLLVIDDDLVQRSIIKRIGIQVGYDTVTAASVEEAERQLCALTFDCITLDLALGGRDGVEILQTLARRGQQTPIIVISGCEARVLDAAVDVAHGLHLNVALAMPKPLKLDELRYAMAPFVSGMESGRAATPSDAKMVSREEFEAALANGEIHVEFVPKVMLADGHVYGAAAQAYWLNKAHGYVGEPILGEVVARLGMGAALAEKVLQETLRAGADIARRRPDFSLMVDVTDMLLADPAALGRIESMVGDAAVAPEHLMIGVRHGALESGGDKLVDMLVRARIKRFGLALLDFGAAPLSLALVARLPFTETVLAESLVTPLGDRPDMLKATRAAIAVAREFGQRSVACGVDKTAIVPILIAAGCEAVYGPALATPTVLMQIPVSVDVPHGKHDIGIGARTNQPTGPDRWSSAGW